uniref:Ig-like domain-containing protein n=1 Tax=Branchiostoma floridae TaxID=7739 RepID=C3Y676_BRAFL|eukprot:XP_002608463.1 hypothetical protein BRAFLDRAFT_96599 [Branchiostoma floridae]
MTLHAILQTAAACDCKLWGYRQLTSKAWDIRCADKYLMVERQLKDTPLEDLRCQAPIIKVFPGNQTARVGDDLSFTCQADCLEGLRFTWLQTNRNTSNWSVETWKLEDLFRENTQGFISHYNRSCVSVLRLRRVSAHDTGSYTCQVTAPHMASGSDTAFLTVNDSYNVVSAVSELVSYNTTSSFRQKDDKIITPARPSIDYIYLLPSHDENSLIVQPVTLHIIVTVVCSHVVTMIAIASVLFLCSLKRNRRLKNVAEMSDFKGVKAAIIQSGLQASAVSFNAGLSSPQAFQHNQCNLYENDNEVSNTNVANGYEMIPDYYNAQAEVDFVQNPTTTEDNIENHQYETIPDYVNAHLEDGVMKARYESVLNCTGHSQNECYNRPTIMMNDVVVYSGSQGNQVRSGNVSLYDIQAAF